MRKVGILFNPNHASAAELVQRLTELISIVDTSVWSCPASDDKYASDRLPGTKMVLSLGGDGTLLRVARLVAPAQVPILSVNLGRLGFATELSKDEALDKISVFLDGKSWVDERSMLQIELPSQPSFSALHALNDVVVGRGTVVRVIKVKASVDNQTIASYRADGVIAATATGSTGYSMAAGGPILHPQSKDILLTPIAPHLGFSTPLVLPQDSVLGMEIQTAHEARGSIDGQVEFSLRNGETVIIKRSPYITRLLRIHPPHLVYKTLTQRLREH